MLCDKFQIPTSEETVYVEDICKNLSNEKIVYERENQIEKAIKSGKNKITDIVKIIYADVDSRLYPAASMSTLAHLKRMIKKGQIKVDGSNLDGFYEIN